MEANIIKVTERGQIPIPPKIRESLEIKEGDSLVVTGHKGSIIIKKTEEDFEFLLKHSEEVAKEMWDNEEDEIWNDV